MKLLHIETQEKIEAEITEVQESDYKLIKKSKQFEFDWLKEKKNHVFKITRLDDEKENPEIQGLLSIIDEKEEYRIHINWIENSNDNKSPNKKIDYVAGCFIAFAIQVSFENGYNGFTSLVPKTELIDLYVKKYNFSQFGRQLGIQGREAINIIKKYQ
ncbi:MAG: hypothetical protein ACI956_001421 [Nonlabens sp.]|jgi:hypothetical protein